MKLIFLNEKAYKSFFDKDPIYKLFNNEKLMQNKEYQELYNEQLELNNLYINKRLINYFCDNYGTSAYYLMNNFRNYGFKPLSIWKSIYGPTIGDGDYTYIYYLPNKKCYLSSENCPKTLAEKFNNKPYTGEQNILYTLEECCKDNNYYDADVFMNDYN